MKKIIATLSICLLCFSLALPYASFAETDTDQSIQADEKEYIEISPDVPIADDTVIVTIKKEYSELNKRYSQANFWPVEISDIEYLTPLLDKNEEHSYIDRDNFRQILAIKIANPGRQNVLDAIDALEENPIVKTAHPNSKVMKQFASPNDTYYYSNQYDVFNYLKIPDAWNLTTGSRNVKVGVIDDGINSHDDLNANVVQKKVFCNLILSEGETETNAPHGTFVAGIIGAKGNNAKGIAGVCWDVSLISLQNHMQGSNIDDLDTVKAINYAAANNIPIINISSGSQLSYDPYRSSILNYKGLVVCAAGNGSINLNTATNKVYPACTDSDNVISVGSIDLNGKLLSPSNYGSKYVDVAVPGRNFSTYFRNNAYICDTSTEESLKHAASYFSGYTSFAAPLVTGVAALLKSYNPNLSAQEIRRAIMDTTTQISDSSKFVSKGLVNAYAALNSVFAADGQVRNYKSILKSNSATKMGEITAQINNDISLTNYVSYKAGSAVPVQSDLSVYGNAVPGQVAFSYINFSKPISSAGTILELRFDSKFKTKDCRNAVSLASGGTYQYPSGTNVTPSLTLTTFLMGDVNQDNVIDSTDYTLALNAASGKATLTGTAQLAADVNGDGSITLTDALYIQQYVQGSRKTF